MKCTKKVSTPQVMNTSIISLPGGAIITLSSEESFTAFSVPTSLGTKKRKRKPTMELEFSILKPIETKRKLQEIDIIFKERLQLEGRILPGE